MATVADRVSELGAALAEAAGGEARAGRLADETVRLLQDTGILRLLQPKAYGGAEADPADWFDALFALGRYSGSAAWVCGIVGAVPFEIAQGSRELQDEIWGSAPSTWVGSVYTTSGRARRVAGGYRLSGTWIWASGIGHCSWVVLGGMVQPESGAPLTAAEATRHFFLPLSECRVDPDVRALAGLSATGSYRLTVDDAFVPDHRVIDPRDLSAGDPSRPEVAAREPLYRMPFAMMFPSTVAALALSLAAGSVHAFVEHSRSRVTRFGNDVTADPHQLRALSIARADVDAGQTQFRHDIDRAWRLTCAGQLVDDAMKREVRRNQVRAVQCAVAAVDELMRLAGGAVMSGDHPLQRFWSDLHVGSMHGANVAEPVLVAYADGYLADA